MDIFSACVGFGPLAIFLVLLGALNLMGRPLVVSGTRETLAVGLALAGLILVGPMRLFMPQEAATHFGPLVWVLLTTFYVLAVTLSIMLSRPRLVVYNTSLDGLRSLLVEIASRLDHDSTWAGNALAMPQLRVQLQLEEFSPMHNVTLRAVGEDQSGSGWQRLEGALRAALGESPVRQTRHGLWLVMCGMAILMALASRVVKDPQAIAHGLAQLLNP